MIIRKAATQDFPVIMAIFARAKIFMRETGNPNQWQDYPTEEIVLQDIAREECFVMESENGIEGVFVMSFRADAEYEQPEAGFAPGQYATLHRLASAGREKGIFDAMLRFAQERADRLLGDTHADNRIIQSLLAKNGFRRRGELIRYGEHFPTYEWKREYLQD